MRKMIQIIYSAKDKIEVVLMSFIWAVIDPLCAVPHVTQTTWRKLVGACSGGQQDREPL